MNRSHVVVAAVVEREGRFLLVEETAGGTHLVLNQPAGHWEENETLLEAVQREALEETGWEVRPTALLGLYHFQPADLDYGFLRVAFVCEALRHHPERKLDAGIARAVWLTPAEIEQQKARHRSPSLSACLRDYLAGRRLPLDAVAHL